MAYWATWRWYTRTETCRSCIFNVHTYLMLCIQLVQ